MSDNPNEMMPRFQFQYNHYEYLLLYTLFHSILSLFYCIVVRKSGSLSLSQIARCNQSGGSVRLLIGQQGLDLSCDSLVRRNSRPLHDIKTISPYLSLEAPRIEDSPIFIDKS